MLFDGDVIVAPWSGDESYVVGEATVWHLPATGDESTIGYVDGVGVVAVGFSGRSSTAKMLVDGAWQRLDLESLNGWPSFAFGRLFLNSIDGGEVGVFDPSSGEFVPVGGPTVRGQIVATGMQSVVWTDPVEGVSVADDGTVVVTARGPAARFGYGPISIYSQPAG